MKKALITGIFGQDGSYLCQILSQKGYDIYGITKSTLSQNSQKIKNHLSSLSINPTVYSIDLNNLNSLCEALLRIRPDEIYHLAAFHVSSQSVSNSQSLNNKQLFDYNLKSTSNLLFICYEYLKNTKILTAGSCLMFDDSETQFQNENTPFKSNSLYGLSKIAENLLVKYYRDKGLHSSTAILYNHESSRRSDQFVTKKIIKSMLAVANNEIDYFTLGNLNAKKDWGWAKDYSYGMFLMMQLETPSDCILASGISNSISDFLDLVAAKLNIDDWRIYVKIDESILARNINTNLLGDWSLAKKQLDWKHTITLPQLIDLMIDNEMNGVII